LEKEILEENKKASKKHVKSIEKGENKSFDYYYQNKD
jgi:hypothetical protein